VPSANPFLDHLLEVYNLNQDRRQAELDLERARTKEQVGSRMAVPAAFAEMAQIEAKKQKAKEAAEKSGQSQAPTPQMMLPPMTDVNGQTSGRGGQALASAAADIFAKVNGGAAIKQGSPLGNATMAGGSTLGAAGAAVLNGALGPGIAQRTPGINPAAAAPGSIVPQKVPLTTGEKWLAGLGSVLSLVGRNPGALMETGGQLISGEKTVGYTQTPTVQEQAAVFARPLSAVRFGMDSKDPQMAAQATAQYQKHLDQIEQQFGKETRDAAEINAEDLYWEKAQAQQLKAEEPARKRAELMFDIENRVHESGKKPEEVLNAGDLALLQGRQTKGATVSVQNITPANRTALNNSIKGTDDLLNQLNSIDDVLTNPDGSFWADPFTLPGKWDYGKLAARDYAGNLVDPLNAEESERLQRYATVDQVMASMTVQQLHSWLGATMSEGEIRLAYPMLPAISKGPQKNQAQLRQLREDIGLSKLRYSTILETGSQVDPRYAQTLSATKLQAKELVRARTEELLKKEGYTPDRVAEQVRDEFKRNWGLDADRLMGVKP
jgi:hypothetical protein